ncbi:MAG: hypothetical protein V9G11_07970 [Bifidobacterium adolescentis]
MLEAKAMATPIEGGEEGVSASVVVESSRRPRGEAEKARLSRPLRCPAATPKLLA